MVHTHQSLSRALVSGASFLCQAQRHDGSWLDFITLAGPSDEWVTGIVLRALATLPPSIRDATTQVGPAVDRASSWLLSRQRPDGGWGYTKHVPSDADSTSHARAALAVIGTVAPTRLEIADEFLSAHIDAGGKVHTYASEEQIRAFTGLDERVTFAGWCAGHPCVTAFAASIATRPLADRMTDALRRLQHSDGSWPAYWWADRAPSTRWAVEALERQRDAALTRTDDRERLRKAVTWLGDRSRSLLTGTDTDGLDAFTAAHLLAGLTAAHVVRSEVDELVAALLGAQCDDGGWPSSAWLRIPPPDVTDPSAVRTWVIGAGGGASVNRDAARLVTTAAVVTALGRPLRERPHGG